jgi:hypothetical protein
MLTQPTPGTPPAPPSSAIVVLGSDFISYLTISS